MAKFRDSHHVSMDNAPTAAQDTGLVVHDRSLGDIIRQTNNLTADQVEEIVSYQREKNVRFGEAAIALGFASDSDVLFALSQQFHYPYAPSEQRSFSDELVVATKPFSPQAESFRNIRSQLMMRLFSGDMQRPAIAVVSPDSGDGKTFFAANLAIALSQLGGRTLLVDGDMRSPRLHTLFGLENKAGLSSILSGRSEANVIQQVLDLPSLFVLPVGAIPPNPLELLERPAFGLLIRELLSKFDFVVVDTPAVVFGADSGVLAARCGAALCIARKGKSGIGPLQDMVANLSEGPTKLAGVILNEF
jgi:protein-tyrosine kinase